MNSLKYIDLFAGGGGLSEGFIQKGFLPVAHVEADEAACYTLKTRAAYYYLLQNKKLEVYTKYLRGKITRDELYAQIPDEILDQVINARIGDDNKSIFKKIDTLSKDEKVDLIIGGPPCQAYSIVGRAPLKHKKNDERTKLYVQYGRFLKRYQPKIFIFENVPGILSSKDGAHFRNLQKYYKRLGYEVEASILNASDYKVIQNRARVIIVGWKKNLKFSYPQIAPIDVAYDRDDIFYDLPVIGPNNNDRVCFYTKRKNKYLKETGIRNGQVFVSQHVTRPHNKKDLAIYKLAIDYLNKGERLKNNLIPRDMRTQKNTTDFLDRFKVVDKTPHTVIAHISKDGHHFIHPDAKQLRSISVREAARIQSFPDDYFFEGTKEGAYRSAAFRQIGNAVPPLLAGYIAKKIKKQLSRLEKKKDKLHGQ